MGIWVRSQDGTNLEERSNFNISATFELVEIASSAKKGKKITKILKTEPYLLKSDECYLGIYKSRERAIEVLDSIQSHIAGSISNKNRPIDADTDYWNSVFAVYQMPKE